MVSEVWQMCIVEVKRSIINDREQEASPTFLVNWLSALDSPRIK